MKSSLLVQAKQQIHADARARRDGENEYQFDTLSHQHTFGPERFSEPNGAKLNMHLAVSPDADCRNSSSLAKSHPILSHHFRGGRARDVPRASYSAQKSELLLSGIGGVAIFLSRVRNYEEVTQSCNCF